MLQDRLIPQQIFLTVLLTVKFPFFHALSEALVMDEMSAVKSSQKGLRFVRTHQTLQLLDFYVQLFAFNDIPPGIFAEVAGESGCQKVIESSRIFQLDFDEALLKIKLLFALSVLALTPFGFIAIFTDEAMPHMFAKFKTTLAQSYVFALSAFIDYLTALDLFQLATIAVVIVLFANLLVYLLLLVLHFLLPDFLDNFWGFLIPAERTLDGSIILHFMLGPLCETLKMEVIFADGGAGSDSIAFDDLHMANSAQVVVIILILLLNNDILAQDAGFYVFYVFEEIGYFVVVNPAVGDDVSQFFVGVCVAEEEGVLVGEVKNFDEGVESVGAVLLGG